MIFSTQDALGAGAKYEGGYSKKLRPRSGPVTIHAKRWLLERMAVVDGALTMRTIGVAYAWEQWSLEDGTICEPGGVRRAPQLSLAEAAEAAEAAALEVRRLKEEDGLGNKDPAVVEAVAEMKRLRAVAEQLQ